MVDWTFSSWRINIRVPAPDRALHLKTRKLITLTSDLCPLPSGSLVCSLSLQALMASSSLSSLIVGLGFTSKPSNYHPLLNGRNWVCSAFPNDSVGCIGLCFCGNSFQDGGGAGFRIKDLVCLPGEGSQPAGDKRTIPQTRQVLGVIGQGS